MFSYTFKHQFLLRQCSREFERVLKGNFSDEGSEERLKKTE